MKRKLLAGFLIFAMLFSLVPTAAFADTATATSVQVGQVELADGEYTTNGTSKITGTPTGTGYAYFKDGVLTLNNFVYSGGSSHSNPDAIGSEYGAIFCEHDLTIKVEGRNSITRVVTDADTNTDATLRGIWNDGDLKIVGDNRDDFIEVTAYGHNGSLSTAIESIEKGIVIENCTLEAKSITGGYGLNANTTIEIIGAKVVGSSEEHSTGRSTFGIYAETLKVVDSDVVGVADNIMTGEANGIWIAGSEGKLIFESGSIVAETSGVSGDSYAIHKVTEGVTLPAKYWMRTSASGDFAEGTWDGANVGPYIELTTTHTHSFTVQQYDADGHWKKCSGCDAIDAKEAHSYGSDNICDVCGYTKSTTNSGGGFSGTYNYPVAVADTDGADVTLSEEHAIEGETVTITVTPSSGKQVDEVMVTDEDGEVIPVTKVGDNQYTFTMPKGKVNVAVTTEAIDYDNKIVMQIGNKNIVVDNRTITNDVAPLLQGDRTLVPIRVIIEALGGSVDWNDAARTVTIIIDGKVLTLVIDEPIPGFGQGATIIDNRTYVPIRYVAEYVGAHVEWIAETQQIVILR